MIGYLFLGTFGGLYGAWFCRANIWWTKRIRNGTFLKSHPIAEVALITVCVSRTLVDESRVIRTDMQE